MFQSAPPHRGFFLTHVSVRGETRREPSGAHVEMDPLNVTIDAAAGGAKSTGKCEGSGGRCWSRSRMVYATLPSAWYLSAYLIYRIFSLPCIP